MQASGIDMTDSERDRLSPSAIAKVSAWLHNCQGEHRSCRWRAASKLPTRVIEVFPNDMLNCIRLVDGDREPEADYIALSHCWGNMPCNRFDL